MDQPQVEVKKVIVAVHGIGDQTRFATVQQALAQFCRYHGEAAGVPLGGFHCGTSLVLPSSYPDELRAYGFAEVYWADIARDVAGERYSLEDIKPWVRTVISRVRRRRSTKPQADVVHEPWWRSALNWLRRRWSPSRDLSTTDLLMVEEVLGEAVQTIGVLGRLCFLAEKMGLFSFDLKKVLVDFVDDVQIVAEFKDHGQAIGKRFAERLEEVHQKYPAAEIYLIAHSEGTVVALLGLLHALCDSKAPDGWIRTVRGFMTFGSPIDKHLILWPELFEGLQQPCVELFPPIEWHNYYDHGDPVGFELETARATFSGEAWAKVFNFPPGHDHGFTRYPLPGKAHTDYWQDGEVFDHFIRTVVAREEAVLPPATKKWAWLVSWCAPYAGALALLACGVLVLHKALTTYLTPKSPEAMLTTIAAVASFTSLLAGVTVLARIPRLTRVWYWRLFGAGFFLLSTAGYRTFACLDPGSRSGAGFARCVATPLRLDSQGLGLISAAVLLLAVIYFAGKRYPTWGMWTLVIPAGIALVLYLARRLAAQPAGHGDFWPVALAAAFFLYVWWLVALLFDLSFVWHRYIRKAVRIFRTEQEAQAPSAGRVSQQSGAALQRA